MSDLTTFRDLAPQPDLFGDLTAEPAPTVTNQPALEEVK